MRGCSMAPALSYTEVLATFSHAPKDLSCAQFKADYGYRAGSQISSSNFCWKRAIKS